MTPRAIFIALLVVASVCARSYGAQERIPLDQVHNAAAELSSNKAIQLQFPGEFDVKKQAEEPAGIDPATMKKPRVAMLQVSIVNLAGVLATMLLFTMVAIGVDIVRRLLPSWSPMLLGESQGGAYTPTEVQAGPPPLDSADGLARAGRFAEAMHTLLLAAVRFVFVRAARPLPDSLTSREILRRPELTKSESRSLATLVGFVERTHFGTRVPTPDDYESCRASFVSLTQLTVRA